MQWEHVPRAKVIHLAKAPLKVTTVVGPAELQFRSIRAANGALPE